MEHNETDYIELMALIRKNGLRESHNTQFTGIKEWVLENDNKFGKLCDEISTLIDSLGEESIEIRKFLLPHYLNFTKIIHTQKKLLNEIIEIMNVIRLSYDNNGDFTCDPGLFNEAISKIEIFEKKYLKMNDIFCKLKLIQKTSNELVIMISEY